MTNSRFQSLDSYYIGDSGGYFQIDIPSVRKRKYLHMYVRPYGRKPPVLSRQFARQCAVHCRRRLTALKAGHTGE